MADARSLQHQDAANKDDETLRREAQQHLASTPALQLIAEILIKLRNVAPAWWHPNDLRSIWDARARMTWYAARPDLRQEITTALTGLPPKAARKKEPEFQAELVDAVIDDGDITTQQFEGAFDPRDLAVYGPAAELWSEMMARLPWENDAAADKELAAWLIEALLAEKSGIGGLTRTPLVTPLEVRAAIDGQVWQTHVPVEVRVAIDAARVAQERDRPTEPFHARQELAFAKPDILAKSIPLDVLRSVFEMAGRAIGFGAEAAVEAKIAASTANAAVADGAAGGAEGAAAKPPVDTAPKGPIKKGPKKPSQPSEPPQVDDDMWGDERKRSIRPAR